MPEAGRCVQKGGMKGPCPKCSGSMAEGFVVDTTHGGAAVSSWVEGAPDRNVWIGVRLSGRPRSEISTWRCNRCGFLEHYAPAAPDRSREKAEQRQVLWVVVISAALLLGLGAALLLR